MTKKEILDRIYPSVVTFMGDWQKMLADTQKLKLKKISLFLTGATPKERKEIFKKLLETNIQEIPHVHARHDMKEEEYDFLVEHYKTKAFTLHYQYLSNVKNSKHKKKIFVENNCGAHGVKNIKALSQVGGTCIDLSHLAEFKIHRQKEYQVAVDMVENYKVGCNHLSAVKKDGMSWHKVSNISELDYVAEIPKKYFSKYINLELANSIEEQLKFKKYIADKLYKTWTKK